MYCKDCGEVMEGDGFSVVVHCPNADFPYSGMTKSLMPPRYTVRIQVSAPTVKVRERLKVSQLTEAHTTAG